MSPAWTRKLNGQLTLEELFTRSFGASRSLLRTPIQPQRVISARRNVLNVTEVSWIREPRHFLRADVDGYRLPPKKVKAVAEWEFRRGVAHGRATPHPTVRL
jgi:hypothetical protein